MNRDSGRFAAGPEQVDFFDSSDLLLPVRAELRRVCTESVNRAGFFLVHSGCPLSDPKCRLLSGAAGWAVAAPVALFLASVWALNRTSDASAGHVALGLTGIALVLIAPFTPQPVLMIGIVCMAMVGIRSISYGGA